MLTRYDVHEERGQFVNKQHGGMGGGGQQQEENHRGRTRHAQSRAGSKQISKPGGKNHEITIYPFIYLDLLEENGTPHASPSKQGTPEQLAEAHHGLQVTKPQGVEAQFLRQILETTKKSKTFNIIQVTEGMM